MSRFDKLAERQILKAQAEGQLDDLKGQGKPLPPTGPDAAADVGFRMMADAGALPEEVALRKAVAAARARLAATADQAARKAVLAELADLEMCRAIQEEIRRNAFR